MSFGTYTSSRTDKSSCVCCHDVDLFSLSPHQRDNVINAQVLCRLRGQGIKLNRTSKNPHHQYYARIYNLLSQRKFRGTWIPTQANCDNQGDCHSFHTGVFFYEYVRDHPHMAEFGVSIKSTTSSPQSITTSQSITPTSQSITSSQTTSSQSTTPTSQSITSSQTTSSSQSITSSPQSITPTSQSITSSSSQSITSSPQSITPTSQFITSSSQSIIPTSRSITFSQPLVTIQPITSSQPLVTIQPNTSSQPLVTIQPSVATTYRFTDTKKKKSVKTKPAKTKSVKTKFSKSDECFNQQSTKVGKNKTKKPIETIKITKLTGDSQRYAVLTVPDVCRLDFSPISDTSDYYSRLQSRVQSAILTGKVCPPKVVVPLEDDIDC